MGLITITKASSRKIFNLNQEDIVKMYEKNSSTIIEYLEEETGLLKVETVTEDIADVFALTTNIAQTIIGGVDVYINANRIIHTTEINSLAVVNYDAGGDKPQVLKLDVDQATFIASLPSASSGPKVYRALISQSGTNAPVLIELENTLGVTITPSRDGVGLYKLTSPSAIFLAGKTYANISEFQIDGAAAQISRISDTEMYVYAGLASTLSPGDGRLVKNSIEILVYN